MRTAGLFPFAKKIYYNIEIQDSGIDSHLGSQFPVRFQYGSLHCKVSIPHGLPPIKGLS